MKDGLRQKLNNWIKSEQGKTIPIDAIERQVKLWGYKISNYERRLRPSDSPNVERIMKNGAIVGDRWKNNPSYYPNDKDLSKVEYVVTKEIMAASEFLQKYPSKPLTPPLQTQPEGQLNF